MGLLSLSVPIGMTLGIATWAVIRGRGGLSGLVLCALFATLGAVLGGIAADAVFEGGSNASVALGSVAGAVLVGVIEAVAFGPRPKRVAWADQKGVAVSQPEDGSAPKSLV